MPKKPKINLEKVRASLNTLCTKCGYPIPPQEIRRVSFYEVLITLPPSVDLVEEGPSVDLGYTKRKRTL